MKNFIKSSITVKTMIAVQTLLLIVTIAQAVSSYNDECSARQRGQEAKLLALADGVINGANMLMINGIISDPDQRKLFIQKMGSSENIKSLRLIRNKLVQKQFGQGLPEEQPAAPDESRALEDGKIFFERRGDVMHAVIPYTESKSFRGTNCLMCHDVPEGYHNGASVIDLDISADNAELDKLIVKSAITVLATQLLFLFSINFILKKFVSTPAGKMRTAIVAVSETHDFTRRIAVDSEDEIGQTANSFNELMGNLQAAFRQLHDGIEKVADSSHSLSQYSRQVAEGSASQTQATSVMAGTVSQVTFGTSIVSAGAADAVNMSRESSELSEKGGQVIHHAAEEMVKIGESVRKTAGSIESLGEQSNQISAIVNVIRGIADQTNLLALNAAIEAARAGELGRGFAVVADEVRKLAERTAKATEDVTGMIATMQTSSHAAADDMAAMVGQVDEGVSLARQAGEAIVQIKTASDQVTGTVSDISNSLEEQGRASDEISAQIEKVSQMTEANSSAASEASSAASYLEQLAAEMRATVERFKI
jgi:methyl-accepting chemotaxis protein